MVKPRDYLPSDIKRLFAFSGNQCSEPKCKRPVIAEDGITVVGKVCHIEAASSKGPRYRKEMKDDERRSYDNLILLCDEHHSIIDNKKNEGEYTKELLLEWKNDHISGNEGSEIEINEETIFSAIDDIVDAIGRLEKNSNKIYSPPINRPPPYLGSGGFIATNDKELFDKIRHFTSNIDVIKQELSEKLDDGGFKDDTDWATELKETYTKRLLKNDVSQAQQKIHAFLLVKVQMAFRRHVLAAIRNGNSKEDIRMLVDDQVISKVGEYLGYDNVLDLYDDDINGMLYFLTGNCHINMILYQPIFDPYHCSYRLLLLLNNLNKTEIEIDKLKIYDFILLYPSFLHKMSLPQAFTHIRRSIKINEYNNTKAVKLVFAQLNQMQNISLNELASTSLIERERLKNGFVKRTESILPDNILESISNQSGEKMKILEFIKNELDKIPINRLKERSGLIEYRYDKI